MTAIVPIGGLRALRQRLPRIEDPKHLVWIRTLPCLVSGVHAGVEAAHVRYADHRFAKRSVGVGEKPDDKWVVPLSCGLHRTDSDAQHKSNEREWWRKRGIDPVIVAAGLYLNTGNDTLAYIIILAARLFPDAPAHSNQGLRYFLKPPNLIREKAALAHRAAPDAYVTAHLLMLMLERASVEQLIEWSSQPAILTRIPFGKLRGQSWDAADEGLLAWVLDKDFDEDVIFTARHHLEKRREERRKSMAAVADDDEMPF